jgi:hypothetical protein
MTTETNRREFEEWARTNTSIGLDLDIDVDEGVEHYWDHSTYAAWEAWQAARERHKTERCAFCNELPQTENEKRICDELMKQDRYEINPPTSEKI